MRADDFDLAAAAIAAELVRLKRACAVADLENERGQPAPETPDVRLIRHRNGTRAEVQRWGHWRSLGFYRDEVDAMSAVAEHLLWQSAISADLRTLPPLTVGVEFCDDTLPLEPRTFSRALKRSAEKVVKLPNAGAKQWLQCA